MTEPTFSHASEGRFGEWIMTYTGRRFYPLDPRSTEISELDLAHHLSNLCRWTGACKRFYSVAQHSVHMAEYAERQGWTWENQFACLLHDASEAYTGDLARPTKHHPSLSAYSEMERRIMDQVWIRFGIQPGQISLRHVKGLDDLILVTEARQLMNLELNPGVPSLPIKLPNWGPKTARAYWIGMFRTIRERTPYKGRTYWRAR